MITVFKETVPILESALTALGAQIEEPSFFDDNDYPRFRHREKSNHLAAYLKAVRIVSALNASLVLLEHGFIEELGVLFRTIDESFQDIIFLLYPQENGGLSEERIKFLDEFYQEEFSDPKNPFMSEQKRNRVPRRKVYAALGKFTGDIVNPSDGAELYRTLSQAMSGFVHGAYTHIMELYGGNPPHFHLNGMLGTPIHESWIMQSWHYYYRGIQALMLLSQAFQNETIATELLDLRNSFEKKISFKRTGNAAKKIRDFKKGRN
ncbi:MAG: hypothetical protein IH999_11025 [Proteobacteria bacterium]|nr:hypothetical protein [Pseudomonadota bacterium]